MGFPRFAGVPAVADHPEDSLSEIESGVGHPATQAGPAQRCLLHRLLEVPGADRGLERGVDLDRRLPTKLLDDLLIVENHVPGQGPQLLTVARKAGEQAQKRGRTGPEVKLVLHGVGQALDEFRRRYHLAVADREGPIRGRWMRHAGLDRADQVADKEQAHLVLNAGQGKRPVAQDRLGQGAQHILILRPIERRKAQDDELDRRLGNGLAQHLLGFETSKHEAEQVLRKTVAESPIELVVLRLPALYGPEKQDVLRALAEGILRNRPLPLASVQNQMSLLFVGNLVSAIEACLENPAAADHTYSLSDGEVVSTPELVERLAEAMQHELDLWPCPTPLLGLLARFAGHGKEFRALTRDVVFDDQEVVRELGWQPPIEVDTALQATVRSWDLEQAVQQPPARRSGLRGRVTDAVFDLGQRIVRMIRSRRDARETREAHST